MGIHIIRIKVLLALLIMGVGNHQRWHRWKLMQRREMRRIERDHRLKVDKLGRGETDRILAAKEIDRILVPVEEIEAVHNHKQKQYLKRVIPTVLSACLETRGRYLFESALNRQPPTSQCWLIPSFVSSTCGCRN